MGSVELGGGTEVSAYYDAFAETYDRGRDRGYHQLIDEQAAEIVSRYGEGRDVLEVGCGTGLVLERLAGFAKRAEGIDLSPGMLEHARSRGLAVQQGNATELPFEDESFDVVCSFKVLAHVPDLQAALLEMARVLRPGGHAVFDLYNSRSLRALIKRVASRRKTSSAYEERSISTRFDRPQTVLDQCPPSLEPVGKYGIRVFTPHPAVFRVPLVKRAFEAAEWRAMDSPLADVAGFVVLVLRKRRS